MNDRPIQPFVVKASSLAIDEKQIRESLQEMAAPDNGLVEMIAVSPYKIMILKVRNKDER